MLITAITRFKLGALYNALKAAGWTNAELARRSNISQSIIGEILNLKRRPTEAQALRIQIAFGEIGQVLDVDTIWPEGFRGLRQSVVLEQCQEISDAALEHYDQSLLSETTTTETNITREALDAALATLPEREREVLTLLYLDGMKTEEVAKVFKVKVQSIQQIQAKAIRHLRHPKRIRLLAGEWMERDETVMETLARMDMPEKVKKRREEEQKALHLAQQSQPHDLLKL